MAESIARQTLLAVIPEREDRTSLHKIFDCSNWKVRFTQTFQEAREALRAYSIGAVLCESRLSDGYSWKDLLREVQRMVNPPPLIVADLLADTVLWAEVLNLGAYDLLMKPFDAREVLHTVTAACRDRENNDAQAVPRLALTQQWNVSSP